MSDANQEEFWNQRYADTRYIFGTKPNRFLADHAHLLRRGMMALVPGDGEGRNGVWLAAQGVDVHAVDISPVGLEKARACRAGGCRHPVRTG